MRRSFPSLGLAVAVAAVAVAPGAVLASSAAGRSSAGRQIVCPLEPSGKVISCCPPPTVPPIPCCASAGTSCAVAVTIASSDNPSTAGHAVTLSGRVSSGVSGVSVALWQQTPASGFKQVAQTTTGSGGAYQFVRADVNTNRRWYVMAAGATSTTLSQSVKAVVTISVSGPHARGRVTPNHAGERVLFEQRTGHGWKIIARPRLTGASRYSLALPGRGQVDFRAVFGGDKRNVRSTSRAFKVVA
jgi:hypothetical protein